MIALCGASRSADAGIWRDGARTADGAGVAASESGCRIAAGNVATREGIIRRFENPYQRTDLVKVRNVIDAAHKRGLF